MISNKTSFAILFVSFFSVSNKALTSVLLGVLVLLYRFQYKYDYAKDKKSKKNIFVSLKKFGKIKSNKNINAN